MGGDGHGHGPGLRLSSWGYGSSLYGMGYMPYSNPDYDDYYGGGAVVAMPPVQLLPADRDPSAAADEAVANPAIAMFDAGRASFKQGNYTEALQQADTALRSCPTTRPCTSSGRFACSPWALRRGRRDALRRALGRARLGLDNAGRPLPRHRSTLRSSGARGVLPVHTDSATARFVLAYHYLTQGHTDAAVNVLKQVVALKPATPSRRSCSGSSTSQDARRCSSPHSGRTTPPQGASIAGTWNAQPAADTAIALTIQPGGDFNWQVTKKGQTQQFAGNSTFGDGMLTLVQDKGPPWSVAWTGRTPIT